jgi:hypothetical protein
MKITAKKIIRELEKKGWSNFNGDWNDIELELITDVRDIIDEILKQHKNISIK